jgi:hypothetical protein
MLTATSGIAEVIGVKDNQANNIPLKDLEVVDGSIGSSLIDGLTKADNPGEVTLPYLVIYNLMIE